MDGDGMSCPRCGKHWLKVEDNKLICSCGYIEEVKPTYEQLLAENEKLKADADYYKKMWIHSNIQTDPPQ